MTETNETVPTRDAALLRIVGDMPGITPSCFAYEACRRGLIANNIGRRWNPQGAGRIGGRELARLEKAKLVHGRGRFGREFELTTSGRELAQTNGTDCGGRHG